MNVRPRPAPPDENWPRRWAQRVAILAALVVGGHVVFGPALAAPRPAPVGWKTATPPSVPPVLSPLAVERLGQEAVESFLRGQDGGRAFHIIKRAKRAVVRVQVSGTMPGRPRKIESAGSGVLVNGGRYVLTAGHVLDTPERSDSAVLSILLTDGRSFRGTFPGVRGGVDGAPDGDWGMVELQGEFPADAPTLPIGPEKPASTVVMLGYSGELGVDAGGNIRPSESLPWIACYPLTFVGTADGAWSGRAKVVAGTMARGGSSGGAILDLEGNLVGLMTSSARSFGWEYESSSEADQPTSYSVADDLFFSGTPVSVFREYVEQIWKR